jgi:hypothetical protein
MAWWWKTRDARTEVAYGIIHSRVEPHTDIGGVRMKTVLIIIGVLVLVIAAAAGGYLYGASQATSAAGVASAGPGGAAPGAPGQTGRGQFGQGQFDPNQQGLQQMRLPGGGTFGAVESVENDILTVKMQDGTTAQVRVTDTTLIEKMMSVALKDLRKGENVTVSGSKGADGITTARSIRVITGQIFFGQDGQGAPQGGQGNRGGQNNQGNQTGGAR